MRHRMFLILQILIKHLLRDRSGVAAIEFALAAPILVAALVGIADVGMGIYKQMQLINAVQAGARYAMTNGWNSVQIQNTITNATDLAAISATPAPTHSCGCPSGATIATATCGSTCASGAPAGTYVTVNAQFAYTPVIPFVGFGGALTLVAQSMVRIQ
jgi:Flp pilus assembly protein TadG